MKRYLIFAAASAAFLCSAGNADAVKLTRPEAVAAAYEYNRWIACEPNNDGRVLRARRFAPNGFHVRVEWLAATDEFDNPETGEYYKDYFYQLETVTVRRVHGRPEVYTPFWGGWYRTRLRATVRWHPSAMVDYSVRAQSKGHR